MNRTFLLCLSNEKYREKYRGKGWGSLDTCTWQATATRPKHGRTMVMLSLIWHIQHGASTPRTQRTRILENYTIKAPSIPTYPHISYWGRPRASAAASLYIDYGLRWFTAGYTGFPRRLTCHAVHLPAIAVLGSIAYFISFGFALSLRNFILFVALCLSTMGHTELTKNLKNMHLSSYE